MLVTVVTPTLDAEPFVGETLASVAAQAYPEVEHIVVDGGSRDATQRLAAAAGARVIVEPGLRQAAAVNRGVAAARGEIVMIVNADDSLHPNAAAALVEALRADPAALAAYGEAEHIADDGRVIDRYPTRAFDPAAFRESCYICQAASAVRRSAFQNVGGLDERLDFAMDYDFWIRLAQRGRFARVDEVVARARMHADSKTLSNRRAVHREVRFILRARYGYVPYAWVYAYASWLLNRHDQFFEQARHRRSAVLLSLVLGVTLNPRHPLRSIGDWFAHRAIGQHR